MIVLAESVISREARGNVTGRQGGGGWLSDEATPLLHEVHGHQVDGGLARRFGVTASSGRRGPVDWQLPPSTVILIGSRMSSIELDT